MNYDAASAWDARRLAQASEFSNHARRLSTFTHTMSDDPGTIVVRPLGEETFRSAKRPDVRGLAVRHDEYCYRAPAGFQPDEEMIFDVFTGPDHLRRFVPRGGTDLYVSLAFQFGHSFLARARRFDWDTWCHYLVGKLFYDKLARVQERMRRKFNTRDDLELQRPLVHLVGRSHVLPDDLGVDPDGLSTPWSVTKLLHVGRQAAIDDGVTAPEKSDVVSYGLLEAALLNPLYLSNDEVARHVQMALFDFSRSGDRVSQDDLAGIWERFHDAIRDHLADDREAFQAWFAGGNSNLQKALANRAGSGRRKLPTASIRRGLLELGWRGHTLVAECLEMFASSFARSLPRTLSDAERQLFEAMYYRRPEFGGLTLMMMRDRFPQLRPIVLRLWERPDDTRLIAALHRMLAYYTEMVPLRREMDRAKARPALLESDRNLDAIAPDEMMSADTSDVGLQEVFQELFERRKVQCRPGCYHSLRGEVESSANGSAQSFILQAFCEEHGLISTLEVSPAELAAVRRSVDDL